MKFSNIAKISADAGKKLVENEYFLPVVYLAGAAGGLAYGTYALVDHIRDRRPGTSTGDVAKIGLPVIVGSGLAFLGVRDLRAGKPMVAEMVTSERRSRAGRRGASARRGRGRGRGRSRRAAETSAE
jgi:hypothetical protein